MNKLLGKRALITAGAQGIGLAISRHLLAAGCDVFIHHLESAEGARALAAEAETLGRRCGSARADLTEGDSCHRLVGEAAGFLGGIDVVINNAGSLVERRPFMASDDAYWDHVLSLNLGSVQRITRAALPHLIAAAESGGGASIVNLSSLAARNGGGPGALAYATAKGAVLTLTRGLAREFGPVGIRVNCVTPGLILGSRFHEVHTPPEAQRAVIASIPLGRAGNPDDVARAVVFLASEFDGFISGAAIDINGGIYGS